jgi:hypothetical protein
MSQKNKPVKYYSPSSTIIIIGTNLGEHDNETNGAGLADHEDSLIKKRLAARAIWSRLIRSGYAALVALTTAAALIFGFSRMFAGSTGEPDTVVTGGGIKLADPEAIAGAPSAPPIDSLGSLLHVMIPPPLADILIALLGGALMGAVVFTAMKVSRSRLRG